MAVIVFDISSYDSLKEADVWIKKIKKHSKGNPVEFLLVGNKVATYGCKSHFVYKFLASYMPLSIAISRYSVKSDCWGEPE